MPTVPKALYNSIIIRSWEKLGSLNEIDLLITKEQLKKIKTDYFLSQKLHKFYDTYFLLLYDDKSKKLIRYHLHIENLTWNHLIYLKGNYARKQSKRLGVFIIPNINWAVSALILHSIIDKKYFKDEYVKFILNAQKNYKEIEKILKTSLSDRIVCKILYLLKNKNFDDLIKLRKEILAELIFRKFSFKFFLSVFHKKILGRKQNVLIFIGPDGAGKTTIAYKIYKILENSGYLVFFEHNSPYKNSFHEKKLRKIIKIPKKLKGTYRFLKFLFTYYNKINDYKRKYQVIIFDRFIYDLYVYSNIPLFLLNIFNSLFAINSNSVYLILANEHILYQRKKEYKIEEYILQLNKFRKMAKNFNFKILYNEYEEDLEKNINFILKELEKLPLF